MAPGQDVVLVAVSTADRQVELDEISVSAPALCLHDKTRGQIVQDLLAGLQEQTRLKQHADAYKETHDQLLAFLRPFFESQQEAQDALAEAYLGLLAGKCKKEHLFRAAKQKAIDRQRRLAVESQLFKRFDTWNSMRDEESGEPEGYEASAFADDFTSPRVEDQDPLEILIRKEELEDGIKDVMSKRKYRRIRKAQWWKDLLEFGKCGNVGTKSDGWIAL